MATKRIFKIMGQRLKIEVTKTQAELDTIVAVSSLCGEYEQEIFNSDCIEIEEMEKILCLKVIENITKKEIIEYYSNIRR